MPTKYIASHLAKAHQKVNNKYKFSHFLSWGDDVEWVDDLPDGYSRLALKVRATEQDGGVIYEPGEYFVKTAALTDTTEVLKVNFVDVQQGDGTVIESPGGQIVFIDGGDNKLFARYLAARYRRHDPTDPLPVDAILISHGDADHFVALAEIKNSLTHPDKRKHLHIFPRRVFHNGLVKGPSKTNGQNTKEIDLLGETVKLPGRKNPVITELYDSVLDAPDIRKNEPFTKWCETLDHWTTHKPFNENQTHHQRLAFGDDDAFAFLTEELQTIRPTSEINVLGPVTIDANGQPGLPFLGKPKPGVDNHGKRTGNSASHTINGHSVVLRLKYGNVRFLFTGDLNDEAEEVLLGHPETRHQLQADVLKAPHHGSAEFLPEFLEAISPVVSVISSGDESAQKEYIHPRASLVAALSRTSRSPRPVVFCTELAAFFKVEGPALTLGTPRKTFFGFSRAAFGMVRIRTDGEVLVVTTDSALPDLREAYAYRIDSQGNATPIDVSIL